VFEFKNSQGTGQPFAQRIAMREEFAAQLRFLRTVQESDIANCIALCGSAALHGIYLRGRRTATIDFIAAPEVAKRFEASVRAQGAAISRRPGQPGFYVDSQSAVLPGMGFGVRVYSRAALLNEVQDHQFSDLSGQTVAVRAFSLRELAAAKLANLVLRNESRDYLDMWLLMQQSQEIYEPVRALCAKRSTAGSSYAPPYPFDAFWACSRFASLESKWDSAISGTINSMPEFRVVYDDLRRWLPRFGDGCS